MNWEFLCLFDGQCELVRATGEHVRVDEPSIIVFPPEHLHGWEGVSATWSAATFHFLPVPMAFEQWVGERDEIWCPLSRRDAQVVTALVTECAGHFRQRVSHSAIVFQKTLCALCQIVIERGTVESTTTLETLKSKEVEKSLHWYESHLRENPTVDTVAAAVHMSGSNLRRIYRSVLGRSPKEIFTDLRLRRALELMGDTSRTLDTIAAESGFANGSDLCRAFRHSKLPPPTKWRKSILSESGGNALQ